MGRLEFQAREKERAVFEAQKAAEEAAAAKMPNEQAPADAAKVDEVHKLYKDLADGRVDDPELAAKIDKMVPTADPAADTLTQQATKPKWV